VQSMTPPRTRFWLPKMGLAAFFTAAVLAGNVLLSSVCPAAPGKPHVRTSSESMMRKVRKVKRAWDRWREPARLRESAAPIEFACALIPDPSVAVVEAAAPGDEGKPVLEDDEPRSAEPDPARYLRPSLEPATLWLGPRPVRVDDDFDARAAHERVASLDVEAASARQQFAAEWRRWSLGRDPGFFEGALEAAFEVPRTLCDGAFGALRACWPTDGCYSLAQEEEGPMVGRLLQLRGPEHTSSALREFAARWVEREQRQFSGPAYYLVAFDDEPADNEELRVEQRKILLDVGRKVYLSKYLGRAEERLKGEAWFVWQWQPVDWLVGPPVLAAYTYFRGWERRISFANTKLYLKLEPIDRIREQLDRDELMVGAFTVEWQFASFPLKLLFSTGIQDGEFLMDFVGIGTSIGDAKKAVYGAAQGREEIND